MIPIYALKSLRNAREADGVASEGDNEVDVDTESTSESAVVVAATNPADIISISGKVSIEIIVLIIDIVCHAKLI